MSVTIAEVRAHLGVDEATLGDDNLQLLIDAAWDEIIDAIGPVGTRTEVLSASGDLLLLGRRASAIVSVTEDDDALDPTDFELIGRRLRRLDDGANPGRYWYGRIVVTYTYDDIDRRKTAQLALIQLGLDARESGSTESERIGDWSETFTATEETRAKRGEIIANLGGRFLFG